MHLECFGHWCGWGVVFQNLTTRWQCTWKLRYFRMQYILIVHFFMYLVLQVSTCLVLCTLQCKLKQFWMFLQSFIQLRINFILIYLEWQVSTCTVYTLQFMIGIDTIFRQNMNMATKGKSSVSTLQYVMGIDTIFRQNMKWHWSWLKIGIGPRGARGQKYTPPEIIRPI